MTYGPAATIILTSLIFALIHILTNRTSLYQFFSWLLAGGIFACAYLVTGSIWIPVIIHFATDLINTFVFNIVGKYSMYEFTPAIDDKHRMVYRIGYTAVLLILLLSFYGGNLKIF